MPAERMKNRQKKSSCVANNGASLNHTPLSSDRCLTMDGITRRWASEGKGNPAGKHSAIIMQWWIQKQSTWMELLISAPLASFSIINRREMSRWARQGNFHNSVKVKMADRPVNDVNLVESSLHLGKNVKARLSSHPVALFLKVIEIWVKISKSDLMNPNLAWPRGFSVWTAE